MERNAFVPITVRGEALTAENSMTNEDLEQTLDSLHQNLADTPQIDEPTAAKMRLLIDEIQLALARTIPSSEPTPSHQPTPFHQPTPSHQTLTERVRELIADFELNHPKLTANLSLIAERLADMGI